MKRLWPRSLTGQMMLAVAIALFLVQGLGAFFVYQAQSERREAGLMSVAAFRLVAETRGHSFLEKLRRERSQRIGHRPRSFELERRSDSPLQAGERRAERAEAQLRQILSDQGLDTEDIVIVFRNITDDPFTLLRIEQRNSRFGGRPDAYDGKVMLAAIRTEPDGDWLVARVRTPWTERDILMPVLLQTLLIYVVLMAAVGFILRRITRPLAALTERVGEFAAKQNLDGQVAPEGPDDVRRLIDAHNGMEARVAALLNEKDVMLGAIGHDLKTPLAALRVRIESVEDEKERGRMAATIEDITRSLDDILFLARVGRPSEIPERNELSALIASVVEEFEDVGGNVELGQAERIVMPLRPALLRRAVRNLISNALRYGGNARVSLDRDGDLANIVVEDDGPGIPDDDIEQMMAPFTRGEPSRNSETGGAGLGLTLAKAIADQHSGRLKLSNRLSQTGEVLGLTAILTLPIN